MRRSIVHGVSVIVLALFVTASTARSADEPVTVRGKAERLLGFAAPAPPTVEQLTVALGEPSSTTAVSAAWKAHGLFLYEERGPVADEAALPNVALVGVWDTTTAAEALSAVDSICTSHNFARTITDVQVNEISELGLIATHFQKGEIHPGCSGMYPTHEVAVEAVLNEGKPAVGALVAWPTFRNVLTSLGKPHAGYPSPWNWTLEGRLTLTASSNGYDFDFATVSAASSKKDLLGRTLKAGDGIVFVTLGYTVTNKTGRTVDEFGNLVEIKAANGAVYEPDHELTTAVALRGETPWLIAQLHPDVPVKMVSVFRMPRTALADARIVVRPDNGWPTEIPLMLR